jgi:hypothetical protein
MPAATMLDFAWHPVIHPNNVLNCKGKGDAAMLACNTIYTNVLTPISSHKLAELQKLAWECAMVNNTAQNLWVCPRVIPQRHCANISQCSAVYWKHRLTELMGFLSAAGDDVDPPSQPEQ